KGKDRARSLIRRHRLAERLFAVVFNLSEEAVHAQACRMEHEKVLTPEAVEGICSFLGHPPTCPHGRPIPPGDCCRLFVNEVRPLVAPLSQGSVGENYRIVFMAPKYHELLERLAGLGVSPGAELHLTQKHPSFVMKVGETEVALDQEITEGIYVVCNER
ncbi:MAG: metal-dependent transcriptional regulator, partial [Deltaproteobacteria bacterium]|nr:metal-dependent transcriptional regulator [Deltaproteobacteria bacterium]